MGGEWRAEKIEVWKMGGEIGGKKLKCGRSGEKCLQCKFHQEFGQHIKDICCEKYVMNKSRRHILQKCCLKFLLISIRQHKYNYAV